MLTFTEIHESIQANRIALKEGKLCLTLNGVTIPIRGVHSIQPVNGDQELWAIPQDPDAIHIQVKESDTITILP